jgi:hypothetical protein
VGPQSNNTIKGSELIKNLLEHFKNPEAATRPLPIPDPLVMPDRVYPIFSMKVLTTFVTAFGVSHIRVRNFTADAVSMQVSTRNNSSFTVRCGKTNCLSLIYICDQFFEKGLMDEKKMNHEIFIDSYCKKNYCRTQNNKTLNIEVVKKRTG